jgi:hypothetical protein
MALSDRKSFWPAIDCSCLKDRLDENERDDKRELERLELLRDHMARKTRNKTLRSWKYWMKRTPAKIYALRIGCACSTWNHKIRVRDLKRGSRRANQRSRIMISGTLLVPILFLVLGTPSLTRLGSTSHLVQGDKRIEWVMILRFVAPSEATNVHLKSGYALISFVIRFASERMEQFPLLSRGWIETLQSLKEWLWRFHDLQIWVLSSSQTSTSTACRTFRSQSHQTLRRSHKRTKAMFCELRLSRINWSGVQLYDFVGSRKNTFTALLMLLPLANLWIKSTFAAPSYSWRTIPYI